MSHCMNCKKDGVVVQCLPGISIIICADCKRKLFEAMKKEEEEEKKKTAQTSDRAGTSGLPSAVNLRESSGDTSSTSSLPAVVNAPSPATLESDNAATGYSSSPQPFSGPLSAQHSPTEFAPYAATANAPETAPPLGHFAAIAEAGVASGVATTSAPSDSPTTQVPSPPSQDSTSR